MASTLEDQLLEAKLAEIRENPPRPPDVEGDPDPDIKREGGSRGRARYDKNGGRYPIYNTENGDVKFPPVSILARKLMETRGDGKPQWTLDRPKGKRYDHDARLSARFGMDIYRLRMETPKYHCPLHEDSEERAMLDEAGFKSKRCPKVLVDIESKNLHFRNKHTGAFKALEREEARARDRREQERHDQMVAILQAISAQNKLQEVKNAS